MRPFAFSQDAAHDTEHIEALKFHQIRIPTYRGHHVIGARHSANPSQEDPQFVETVAWTPVGWVVLPQAIL